MGKKSQKAENATQELQTVSSSQLITIAQLKTEKESWQKSFVQKIINYSKSQVEYWNKLPFVYVTLALRGNSGLGYFEHVRLGYYPLPYGYWIDLETGEIVRRFYSPKSSTPITEVDYPTIQSIDLTFFEGKSIYEKYNIKFNMSIESQSIEAITKEKEELHKYNITPIYKRLNLTNKEK